MQESGKVGWNFDNTYIQLPEIFFEIQRPTSVKESSLVILNDSYAEKMGLNIDVLRSKQSIDTLTGNEIPEGAQPLAQAYAGHQYGHFTMLGDGRVILLGEHITPNGTRLDIQLKGAGRTPYSRGGDGRAALGPMLREYIISEAMFALGIPTTRSLSVVATGETVIRDKAYQGAVLTRVASSHMRVGTFQYVAGLRNREVLRTLADYTMKRHFCKMEDDSKYLRFLREVIKRQAKLIAQWQCVGFIHGVMNTDNMTISGETIDYGPCAFMDTYNPETVFSSIDRYGRYAYQNQPRIAAWNLARFAETLLILIDENVEKAANLAEHEITLFDSYYKKYWLTQMGKKLGILDATEEDEELIKTLLDLMHKYNADFTNTFRSLARIELEDTPIFDSEDFKCWYDSWQRRLASQELSKKQLEAFMKNNNPAIIPRNYRVEEALEAANNGNYNEVESLLHILKNPFAYTNEQESFASLPPKSRGIYKTFCGT